MRKLRRIVEVIFEFAEFIDYIENIMDFIVGRSRSAAGEICHVVYLSKYSIRGAYNQTGVYYEQERATTI